MQSPQVTIMCFCCVNPVSRSCNVLCFNKMRFCLWLRARFDTFKAGFLFAVANEPLPIRPTSFQVDDLTNRRPKVSLSRQNSRQSVKSLIESIENAGKPVTKTVSLNSVSRSSSASSINSITSDARSPSSPIGAPSLSPGSPLRTPGDWNEPVKTPLKEQQPNKMNRDWSKGVIAGVNSIFILSSQFDISRKCQMSLGSGGELSFCQVAFELLRI